MSDLKIYDDYNTLPEQVQINKDDIKTNTADIAKLKDDIGKIKPNAWEKNTSIIEGVYTLEQYIPADFNSDIPYSFVKTNIDKSGNPTYQNIGLMAGKLIDNSTSTSNLSVQLILSDLSNINITENNISFRFGIDTSTIEMKYENDDAILFLDNTRFQFDKGEFITEFSNSDVHDYHQILTAFAVNQFYLKKSDASNTYVSKEEYDKRFDTGVISLTNQGLNKIKALTDTPNQTIELHTPADFLELAQQPSGKDLKLQIIYNGSPLYDNIVLQSNRTIENYDNISSSSPKTAWYTGQAIITLSSQSNGLFDIAYHNGNLLGLHLITTF